jgi:hypothetical protein
MTAHELAKLLLTYPDVPMRVALIGVEGGMEVANVDSTEDVRLEIRTDQRGNRTVTVLATLENMGEVVWA